jgi:hypothetical protein
MLHPQSENIFKGLDSGIKLMTEVCGTIQSNASDAMSSVVLKILANNFNHNSNKYAMGKNLSLICDSLLILIGKMSDNKNVTGSLATLILNYSVSINERPLSENHLEQYAKVLVAVFKKEKSNTNLLKYLVAVGNLLLRQAPSFKAIVKSHLSETVRNLSIQVQDEDTQKVKEALKEVLSLL